MRILFQCHNLHLRLPDSDTHLHKWVLSAHLPLTFFFFCLSQSLFHLGILTASFRNQSHQELKLQHLDSWNLDTMMSVEFAVTLTLVSVTEFHWKFYCVQKVQHNTSPNCLFGVVRSSWRSSAPRHHKQPTLI